MSSTSGQEKRGKGLKKITPIYEIVDNKSYIKRDVLAILRFCSGMDVFRIVDWGRGMGKGGCVISNFVS